MPARQTPARRTPACRTHALPGSVAHPSRQRHARQRTCYEAVHRSRAARVPSPGVSSTLPSPNSLDAAELALWTRPSRPRFNPPPSAGCSLHGAPLCDMRSGQSRGGRPGQAAVRLPGPSSKITASASNARQRATQAEHRSGAEHGADADCAPARGQDACTPSGRVHLSAGRFQAVAELQSAVSRRHG